MQVMHTYVGHKNLDVSIRDFMCYFSSGWESAGVISSAWVLGRGGRWCLPCLFTFFIYLKERKTFKAKFPTDVPHSHPQVTLAVCSTGLCLKLTGRSSTVLSSL